MVSSWCKKGKKSQGVRPIPPEVYELGEDLNEKIPEAIYDYLGLESPAIRRGGRR